MKTPNLYGKEQSVHEQVEAETRFVIRSRCALGKYIQSDNVWLADCSCVLFNKMVIYAPLIIQSQSAPGRPGAVRSSPATRRRSRHDSSPVHW